jgi:DNA-binding winged helix-turn-helix (wHTH) protein/tetratricopeptide (TPR) repeat protein
MSSSKPLNTKRIFRFEPYCLRIPERLLERGGKPVPIPEKTFDVLYALVLSSGQLLEREALMRAAWPDTFVEESNIAFQISTLRKVLDDSAAAPRFIATVPKRGYRFIAEVVEEECQQEALPEQVTRQPTLLADAPAAQARPVRSFNWTWAASAIAFVLLAASIVFIVKPRSQSVSALTEKSTIVLADFENKTGESVFDGTLRQGLLVELQQSPFLSLLSEQRVNKTLSLMRLPAMAAITHQVAVSICQRTGSTVAVDGSIERVGGLYVLGLNATNCETGGLIDSEQGKVKNKEGVLDALSAMASRFRAHVGESATTLHQHNASLAEATTSSAEALKAYSMAWTLHTNRGVADAIPLLRHAVELDPEFAMAHAALGRMYADIDESDLSVQSLRRAWELRDHASDREKFFITMNYLALATGNMEEARKVAEAWALTYPRDSVPHTLLSGLPNKVTGHYEEAIAQAHKALELDPDYGMSYFNLAVNNLYLQQFDAAAAALDAGIKRGIELEEFQMLAYDLAFLRQDLRSLDQIVKRARQRSGTVSWIDNKEAFRFAYSGNLRKARSLSEQAVARAQAVNEQERAGLWEAGEAVREAMVGTQPEAVNSAHAATRLSMDREVAYGAGLAFAMAGDSAHAQAIVDGLQKRFPEDTSVRFVYLPVMKAQIALNSNNPALALEVLKPTMALELGVSRCPINTLYGALYPIYFRGLALLASGRGGAAAVNFQKIIDHNGIVLSDPVGAVAQVQLGRSYRLAGERAKAKAAYEGFLRLWRRADPEIPILRMAQSEYSDLTGQSAR